jgi:chorismate mutase
MVPYPEIIPACDVQAIDCSGGLEKCTSMLLAQLQGFVEQSFGSYFTQS